MRKGCLTLAIGLLLLATSALGEEALLRFVVLRDYNGKPVRNAGVVMHPVNKSGKQSRGGFELKTDAEGKASFDGVHPQEPRHRGSRQLPLRKAPECLQPGFLEHPQVSD